MVKISVNTRDFVRELDGDDWWDAMTEFFLCPEPERSIEEMCRHLLENESQAFFMLTEAVEKITKEFDQP